MTTASKLYRELAELTFAAHMATDEYEIAWRRAARKTALDQADSLVGKTDAEIAALLSGLVVNDPDCQAALVRRQESCKAKLAKEGEIAAAKVDGSIYVDLTRSMPQ